MTNQSSNSTKVHSSDTVTLLGLLGKYGRTVTAYKSMGDLQADTSPQTLYEQEVKALASSFLFLSFVLHV